jgi:hypothetical protein
VFSAISLCFLLFQKGNKQVLHLGINWVSRYSKTTCLLGYTNCYAPLELSHPLTER